jgi:hypothetical protein
MHTSINVPGILTIFVDMNCGIWIHLFLLDGDPPAMLRDYSEPYFSSRHWNMSFAPDNRDFLEPTIGSLVRNNAPIIGNCTVRAAFEGRASRTPNASDAAKRKGKTTTIIIAVTASIEVIVIETAVVTIPVRAKRRRDI